MWNMFSLESFRSSLNCYSLNKEKSLFATSSEWNFRDLIVLSDLCRIGEKKRDVCFSRLDLFLN